MNGTYHWAEAVEEDWEDVGLRSPKGQVISKILREYGIEKPFLLQQQAFERILKEDRDVLLTTACGSGKTLAYLLPLLEAHVFNDKIEPGQKPGSGGPRLIILAPNLELAAHTHRVVSDLLRPFKELHASLLVKGDGHKAADQEQELLLKKPVVVVGTPGRVMDLMVQDWLMLEKLKALVLDEVDLMLAVHRQDHLDNIMTGLVMDQARKLQIVLVSASCAACPTTRAWADARLRLPYVFVGPNKGMDMVPKVLHLVNGAPNAEKGLRFLGRLLLSEPKPTGVLVFCNKFPRAEEVATELWKLNISTNLLAGKLSKEAREAAVRDLALGKVDVLVATDETTRGMDIPDVTHVVNFDLPSTALRYGQRAGRCGRGGASGIVISLGIAGAANRLLVKYAEELNITLYEANVDNGRLLLSSRADSGGRAPASRAAPSSLSGASVASVT